MAIEDELRIDNSGFYFDSANNDAPKTIHSYGSISTHKSSCVADNTDEDNDHRGGHNSPHGESAKTKTPSKKYTPEQKRLLIGMVIVSALNGSLMAVMIPFFPVEASSRGVSQLVISAVFSCFALSQLLLYPLVGRLSLCIGVTRLYNIGIATAGVSTVLFGTLAFFSSTDVFVAGCFLVRMIEAAGTAAVTSCAFTIIGNKFGSSASGAVALVSAAQSAGMAVAPAVGGGLYAVAGFGAPFFVLGGIMIVAAGINVTYMPAVEKSNDTEAVKVVTMLRAMIGDHENWLCLLIVFFYSFDFFTFESCVAPYVDANLGITPASLGFYFLVATGAYVLTSYLWAWLSDHTSNPYPQMAACILVVVASQIFIAPEPVLGLKPNWWLVGIGMTLMEAFFGGAYIPCFQLMLRNCVHGGLQDDLTTHAFVSSVYWLAYSLGTVVGPVSGGLLVDTVGFPLMMNAMSALTLVLFLLTTIQAFFSWCRARNPEYARLD